MCPLLQTERTAATLLHILDDAAQQATALAEHSPQRAQHACTAGCCFCCHLPVDITPIEALGMALYLRETLAPDVFAATVERIAATAARLQGLSCEEHAQAKEPCALLLDGQCLVYARRPFACRAWLSTSVARCEEMIQGDPLAILPPLDTETYHAIWEIVHEVMHRMTAARLEGGSYELHSALSRALALPGAVQQWLHGEAVFAGCTSGAFTACGSRFASHDS
jgi:hypothetical protein